MHPQTVYDAVGLTALRNAAATTHAALAANLDAYLAANRGASGDAEHAAAYAIMTRLRGDRSPDRTAAQAIISGLLARAWSHDHDLGQATDLAAGAIAYDVYHDLLTSTDRTAFQTKIADSATDLAGAVTATPPVWWVHDLVQNHNWVDFAALGVAGQALETEHPQAQDWQALAATNSTRIGAVQDLVTDGSWHEGIGYLEFGLSHELARWLGAVRRGDDRDRTNLLANLGRYVLYAQLPNQPRVHVMTHADWNWSRPGLVAVLRWAARRYGDRYAAEAARRWDLQGPRLVRREFGLAYALEYLAYDPGVTPVDPPDLPLDCYHPDQQSVVLRSSWDCAVTPPATGIVLGFKAGVFGGRGNYERMRTCAANPGGVLNVSHDHEDDLGLWIYGGGGWLLPEAVAYNCCDPTTSEYQSTRWHNTLLFDGQGQLGDTKTVQHETAKSCGPSGPPAWFFDRDASLPVHASTAHYAFAAGDGTKLYPAALGVTALTRTVALCRELGGFVVLRDRAVLSTPRTVEQLFHAMESAAPDDTDPRWLRLTNRGGTVLGVRVVAPGAHTAQVTSQLSNSYQEFMDDDGVFALVRVGTPQPTADAAFLEVLWPQGAGAWAARPAVTPLDAGAPHRGFTMPVGAAQESWVFDATAAADLAVTGTGAAVVGVRRTGPTGVDRLVVLGGGALSDAGGVLLDLGGNPGVLEVELAGATARLSGTAEPVGVRFRGPAVTDVRWEGAPLQTSTAGDVVTVTGR